MILQLNCEQCGAPVSSNNVNIEKAIAKCDLCGAVFSFENKIPPQVAEKPPLNLELPEGIDMLKLAGELTLYIKWSSAFNKFLILFSAIWNSVVFLFVLVAILTGQLIILLFISIHLAVAIGLTWYLVALWYNTTEIVVNRQMISVRHKPIWVPFYHNRDVASVDIQQLFSKQYVAGTVNGQPRYAFEVRLLTTGGKELRLLYGLKNSQQAQYIEQEIEKYLKIKDVRVLGEL
ncbi:hypothetical protein C7N43_32290 [Sphingobacteriales bacterium UPWRP_1]|nr:hypothetical protein B6N25_17500 [Sphingobacteriales bacterium TSM_CSS]PSJ72830.1 hypothetical protein C7N43_32290 [Sphingobacteriales bacterium UPWRP_1]